MSRLRLFLPIVLFTTARMAEAADFTVQTPGGQFAFQINGQNSPTLSLERGRTYTFDVATSSFHPFRLNAPGAPSPTFSGTLTWTVPAAVANYTYDCAVHGISLQGTILTVAPSEPPVIRILSLAVGGQLVIKSTGTNTWSVLPEFNTNLVSTNWSALTVNSNRFVNGTNETFCGVPPGTNVFVRIRSTAN